MSLSHEVRGIFRYLLGLEGMLSTGKLYYLRIRHSCRLRMYVLLAISIFYSAACMLYLKDDLVLAYAVIPVLAAGWFYGLKVGLSAAALILPIHLLPRIIFGELEWGSLLRFDGGTYYLMLLFIGAVAGKFRDVNLNLNEKMDEIQRREGALRVQQMRLRALVAQASLDEERDRRAVATGIMEKMDRSYHYITDSLTALTGSGHESGELVQQVQESIRKTHREMESILFALSPPILYSSGLQAAVGWLTLQLRREYGKNIDYAHSGNIDILEEQLMVLMYQTIRELLVNACVHANASTVSVAVGQTETGLEVIVEDDGDGFDALSLDARPYANGGFGLFSIQERISYLGGRVDIASAVGEGTRVAINLRLDDKT